MEKNNPKYKNQGIHLVSVIFTIDKGITKVLLIRRSNTPYNDMWALVGGALYNDEEVHDGMLREIEEKTGISNIHIELFDVFSKVDRSPVMRMVALAHLGIVDKDKYQVLKNTLKTSDCDWFPIDGVPKLAYDHNEILNRAYESILNTTFDRRNFRKKILSLGFIEETNRVEKFSGNKPAKVYIFKENSGNDKNVF